MFLQGLSIICNFYKRLCVDVTSSPKITKKIIRPTTFYIIIDHIMLPINAANILAAEEEERLEQIRVENMERRIMREESDPFSIENTRFKELYRLNKDMAQYIFNGILPQLNQSNNPVAIPSIVKFFGVLNFFATGTYQRVIGRSFDISLSQQSMSRAIQEVTAAIVNTFSEHWVHFPTTVEEKNEIKRRFMEARNFPGVIGAVDCTHIEILKPIIQEHNYLNRKGYHSKNVQIICDYDLKILNINGQFAGATHDSYIWRHSLVRTALEASYQRGDINSWLLGDSGYPQEPWLMTPIENALPGSAESRYTEAHIQARNYVERCIGVYKGRFLCLSKVMRYSPEKVGYIASACAILHNICVAARLDIDFDMFPPEEPINNDEVPNAPLVIRDGNMARRNLVQRYFNNN